MKYKIIFDTNILYVNYDKGGDFTKFYFNSTLTNIIGYIEQSDLYDYIGILLPETIWNEMRKQKIEAYYKKKSEFETKIEKIIFPEIVINRNEIDYESYILQKMQDYKAKLNDGLMNFDEIKLPTQECYNSLLNRAFNKLPPFEGKDKNSDKGFKDALLWESILQYKKRYSREKLILYCNDKMFNEELKLEYQNIFGEEILIVRNEEEILEIINKISKAINKYSYINDEIEQIEKIKKVLTSKEFCLKMLDDIATRNIFNDIYIIEDINSMDVEDIKSINENETYEAKLKFNVLFNKVNGMVEDIIEKIEEVVIYFKYSNNKIENISYKYRNTYFEEGNNDEI